MTQEIADSWNDFLEKAGDGERGVIEAVGKGISAWNVAKELLVDNVKLENRIKELEDKLSRQ